MCVGSDGNEALGGSWLTLGVGITRSALPVHIFIERERLYGGYEVKLPTKYLFFLNVLIFIYF